MSTYGTPTLLWDDNALPTGAEVRVRFSLDKAQGTPLHPVLGQLFHIMANAWVMYESERACWLPDWQVPVIVAVYHLGLC